jgi:hypothetical protein
MTPTQDQYDNCIIEIYMQVMKKDIDSVKHLLDPKIPDAIQKTVFA